MTKFRSLEEGPSSDSVRRRSVIPAPTRFVLPRSTSRVIRNKFPIRRLFETSLVNRASPDSCSVVSKRKSWPMVCRVYCSASCGNTLKKSYSPRKRNKHKTIIMTISIRFWVWSESRTQMLSVASETNTIFKKQPWRRVFGCYRKRICKTHMVASVKKAIQAVKSKNSAHYF